MSDPISITVEKSETLSMDSIVGKQRHKSGSPANDAIASRTLEPEFTNDSSADVLVSQSPASSSEWWWLFVIVPPTVWLTAVLVRSRTIIGSRLPRFRSAKCRCLSAIDHAHESSELVTPMIRYIESRTGQTCVTSATAVGALRTSGMTQSAIDIEAFFQRCEQSQFGDSTLQSLTDYRKEACEHV